MTGLPLLAALTSAIAVAGLVALLAPPTRRLAPRVRPYLPDADVALGQAIDPTALIGGAAGPLGVLRRLLGPPLVALLGAVTRRVGSSGEEELLRRLHNAGHLTEVPEPMRVHQFRLEQVLHGLGGLIAGMAAGSLVRGVGLTALGLGLLGAVAGASRPRARLDRAIERRRDRIRIELYTVNQLLAMHIRVGGGVSQALRRVVDRGRGAVVEELAGVLRLHHSGVPVHEALTRAARRCAEPHLARTLRLLANGSRYGADLADALLEHADDVRVSRRDALKRAATRRRAAMLVPIIGVLAPVMLLFIAAPIPSLIFGAR